MPQAEHVGCLVNEDFTAPPQQDFFIVTSAFLAVEGRVVTGEAINPDTSPKRGMAENKIPRGIMIEVLNRHRQQAKGIRRKISSENGQDIKGQDLSIVGVWIRSRRDLLVVYHQARENLNVHREVSAGVFLQSLY